MTDSKLQDRTFLLLLIAVSIAFLAILWPYYEAVFWGVASRSTAPGAGRVAAVSPAPTPWVPPGSREATGAGSWPPSGSTPQAASTSVELASKDASDARGADMRTNVFR